MKAWRQKKNQDPVRKEWTESESRSPKDVLPSRWGRLTKVSVGYGGKVPALCSVLLIILMMRGGWIHKDAMA